MPVTSNKNRLDKRAKQRKPYSGSIFFTTKNGFHQGRLKNFSRYGLFIDTTENLAVGEIITIYATHTLVQLRIATIHLILFKYLPSVR